MEYIFKFPVTVSVRAPTESEARQAVLLFANLGMDGVLTEVIGEFNGTIMREDISIESADVFIGGAGDLYLSHTRRGG